MRNISSSPFIREGFRQAQAITKHHAHTFYFASYFLPREKRRASYAIYALCRASDESVDSSLKDNPQKALTLIQEKINAAYGNKPLSEGLLAAFRYVIERYHIPKEYFDDLLAGMRMDIEINRYPDFTALLDYSYKAAGVVGLIMLYVFTFKDERAKKCAISLGIAFQLTNILRDIKEDLLERNRIYLPTDEMKNFNVTEKNLKNGELNEAVKNMLKKEIARVKTFYAQGRRGIKLISNRRCRFVTLIMLELYAEILSVIEKNNYDVFSLRAVVPFGRKIHLTIGLLLKGAYL